jgi:glucose-6-phosphate isomerase
MSAIWSKLADDKMAMDDVSIAAMYRDDAAREQDFSVTLANGFALYYGRQYLSRDAVTSLLSLAKDTNIEAKRDAMAQGERINTSENRAVLHMACRAQDGAKFAVDGADVTKDVWDVLARMTDFAEKIRNGDITGATGKAFKTILHIGIGGSELGPRAVCHALSGYASPGVSVHFVGNVDGGVLALLLPKLDPEETLVLIASKTFKTDETMTNAGIARAWLAQHLGDANAGAHMAALSVNVEAAQGLGIAPDRVFPFADWVGGRFSIWSSIGLPVMLYAGPHAFKDFLAGAADMDLHFLSAPPERNIPILHGLLSVWNRNVLKAASYAVLPYSDALRDLPAYLQQLIMESNGKQVAKDGQPVPVLTSPVIFGAAGTDCQHSFMQMLHQSADIVPADLIGVLKPGHAYPVSHKKLLANMLAQSTALLQGRDHDDPRQRMPGSRPHNLVMLPEMSPFTLGQLLALYEHSTTVQGFIWNINSFDQPGVELGKIIAKDIETALPDQDLTQDGFAAFLRSLHAPVGR